MHANIQHEKHTTKLGLTAKVRSNMESGDGSFKERVIWGREQEKVEVIQKLKQNVK